MSFCGEYVQAIRQASALEVEMGWIEADGSLAPVVEGLMALSSVSLTTAMTVVMELGDTTRLIRRVP